MRYLTGFHAIEEALKKGGVEGLLRVSGSGPRIKRILETAAKDGIRVERTSPAELDTVAPDNRGVVLALTSDASPGNDVDLDEFLTRLSRPDALVLILDHVTDPHNYGAILRSADVLGADLVIIPERRSAHDTDTVARSSAGAVAWVPVAVVPNLVRALSALQENGFWGYAADMAGEDIGKAELPARSAIVLGSEGYGVSRLLKETCDGSWKIPQRGNVDSLNVSVAAGLVMWEYRRRHSNP
jgi:23S rRNA (guanosine2251-2'-O)-methyltransferase